MPYRHLVAAAKPASLVEGTQLVVEEAIIGILLADPGGRRRRRHRRRPKPAPHHGDQRDGGDGRQDPQAGDDRR